MIRFFITPKTEENIFSSQYCLQQGKK
jgi:DNA modification methylase